MTHPDARKTYYAVFALLVVLTITTVAVSMVELGRFHVVAALLIAFMKVSLLSNGFVSAADVNRVTITTSTSVATGNRVAEANPENNCDVPYSCR